MLSINLKPKTENIIKLILSQYENQEDFAHSIIDKWDLKRGENKMNSIEYAQQIVNNLAFLPQSKLIEIYDFVQFLKEQTQKKSSQPNISRFSNRELIKLRHKLSTFSEDWNLKEMDIYDEI